MLCFHLLNRTNLSPETGELGEFLLDVQQPCLTLAVGDMGLCVESVLNTILLMRFLKLQDFSTETGDLFA